LIQRRKAVKVSAIEVDWNAAAAQSLERTLGGLVNQAYTLAPAENALMWQTASPRMPILRSA